MTITRVYCTPSGAGGEDSEDKDASEDEDKLVIHEGGERRADAEDDVQEVLTVGGFSVDLPQSIISFYSDPHRRWVQCWPPLIYY